MKVNFEILKDAYFGAERVWEEDGKVYASRYTAAEEDVYKYGDRPDFYTKSLMSSGIRISFVSDTESLKFGYDIESMLSAKDIEARNIANIDVYVDGVLSHHFGNGTDVRENSADVKLSSGEKHIEIYLPWFARAIIYDFEIDDGASFTPKKRNKTMVCYGDSITQGYDALYPSLTYASIVSRLLDADSVNKAIGGEKFRPELLIEKNGSPDYITVAYGINDWACFERDFVDKRSREFYERVSELYPDSKIFVITPIRYLNDSVSSFGSPACVMDEFLRKNCEGLPNVTVINGWYLTPALPEFYSDKVLHPNDMGFSVYAENLYKAIRALI